MKPILSAFLLGGLFCGSMVSARPLVNTFDVQEDERITVLDQEQPAYDSTFMTSDEIMNRGLGVLIPDFDSLPAESLARIEEAKKEYFLGIAQESCLLQDQLAQGEIDIHVYSQGIKELRKRFFAALYVLLSVVLVECDKSIEVLQ